VEPIQIVSISKEFNNDLTTPMAAYLRLNEVDAFLLESVEKGESVGRYSIIGLQPLIKVQGYSDFVCLVSNGNQSMIDGDPLDTLKTIYQQIEQDNNGDPPINNGFFGYFSWEIIGAIEDVDIQRHSDQLYEFQLPKILIVFDHAKQTMTITISTMDGRDGVDDMNEVLYKIQSPLAATMHASVVEPVDMNWDNIRSNWTKDEYKDGVEKIKAHIKEGNIFQGVLSQKFKLNSDKESLSVYRALRHINPSPYMFYFNYGDYKLIGSSPEILVKATGKVATLRPIAGTRKRGEVADETALIDELKTDEKEMAEHIMLVDLGRNDLGRVCQYDSVKVSGLMGIEMYSHVMHMVTNVTGTLLHGITPIDLFKAVFPAGTVSGAPKIRAIEIINDIEPDPRHIYSGAVGYFNLDGDMDFCIAIRTIIKTKDGSYEVQAGGGIVNDSDADREYHETLMKAEGVLLACLSGATP